MQRTTNKTTEPEGPAVLPAVSPQSTNLPANTEETRCTVQS